MLRRNTCRNHSGVPLQADILRQASPQLAAELAADMAPQPCGCGATVPAQAGASAAQTASPSGAGAAAGGTGGAKRGAEDALQSDAGVSPDLCCIRVSAFPCFSLQSVSQASTGSFFRVE